MARVIVVSGMDAGVEYKINREIILGRHSDNDVPLADPKASRRHSRIFCEKERYYIEDMESRNGLQLNGNSVKHKELKPGDKITIGNTVLLFYKNDTKPGREEISKKFARAMPAKAKTALCEIKRKPALLAGNKDRKPLYRARTLLNMFSGFMSDHSLFSRGITAVFILIFTIVVAVISRWATLYLLG